MNCDKKQDRHSVTLKKNVVGLIGILIVMALTACSNEAEASELAEQNMQAEQEAAEVEQETEQVEDSEQAEDIEQAEKEDSSQQNLSEKIAMELSRAEEREKEIEKKQEEAITQTEMNVSATEMYQLWDDTLNTVWGMLEVNLNKADMEILRKEEREWIVSKDAEVQAAGQESEGGSIQPLLEATKAAELTRARVYELAEYAK